MIFFIYLMLHFVRTASLKLVFLSNILGAMALLNVVMEKALYKSPVNIFLLYYIEDKIVYQQHLIRA